MKTSLTIFVSGAKCLREHRTRLKALANNMNAENRLKGKKISLNMFSYMNLGDNQNDYNDFIENQADIVLYIIEDHIGDKTRDEFILASKTFKKTGTPRMYVFIKEHETKTPKIKEAEQLVNEYCDSYYIEYSNLEDLETKVKDRLNQEISKMEEKTSKSPKKTIRALWIGLTMSFLAIILLLFGLVGKNDVTMILVGGGSALNCLMEYEEVRDGYIIADVINLPVPTKASWPLVSGEFLHQHALRNSNHGKLFYPISLSAMEASEDDFLMMANKDQFISKCSVLGIHLGDDTLTIYVKNTYQNPLIDGKTSITTSELAALIRKVVGTNLTFFTTDEGSGTLTYYKRFIEPWGVDLSKSALGSQVERFSDQTPKSKIRKDDTPYIMFGSRYYVAKEVYESGDCRAIAITQEDGTAISKPIYLYFAGYNTDNGTSYQIPRKMTTLLKQINPEFGKIIKNNKLPRDNESVIVYIDQYLNKR